MAHCRTIPRRPGARERAFRSEEAITKALNDTNNQREEPSSVAARSIRRLLTFVESKREQTSRGEEPEMIPGASLSLIQVVYNFSLK